MNKELKTTNWILFVIMILLVTIASFTGWISASLYSHNTSDLIIRSRFYDLAVLSIAIPVSLITLIYSLKNNPKANILTLGITVYILFSYVVTVFTINQNMLFLIYVTIISFGAFYLVKKFHLILDSNKIQMPNRLIKWISMILLFSAISGFGYWIVDSIIWLTSHHGDNENTSVKVPQVIDMAFALPFTIYGAIKMWRGKKNGMLISLIMLVFFILIGFSVIIMELGFSIQTKTELDYGKVISYSIISALNLTMSIVAYRKLTIERD